jgi:predicted phage terminase large subunit-like protein
LIEDKASGTQLIQDLQRELVEIKPYEPPQGTDKLVRLHVQAIAFENGSVILPREAAWLEDYVTEITTFPGTKHDDQVDSTTQALDYMRNNNSLEIWAKLGQ